MSATIPQIDPLADLRALRDHLAGTMASFPALPARAVAHGDLVDVGLTYARVLDLLVIHDPSAAPSAINAQIREHLDMLTFALASDASEPDVPGTTRQYDLDDRFPSAWLQEDPQPGDVTPTPAQIEALEALAETTIGQARVGAVNAEVHPGGRLASLTIGQLRDETDVIVDARAALAAACVDAARLARAAMADTDLDIRCSAARALLSNPYQEA